MEEERLKYKEYIGDVKVDIDGMLYGRVLNITDHVIYEGIDREALEKDFRESVDEYEAFCKETDILIEFKEVSA